ncbi:MAG: hypothetical protein U5L09_10275 [Bacteroidales bacterium]|nr:hypothetical protein [Bacteroidales bacterium]
MLWISIKNKFTQAEILAAGSRTSAFYPDADAGEAGKSMLESMGGKKVGNEKFMGYNCEVWELSGGNNVWIYKGAMLRKQKLRCSAPLQLPKLLPQNSI